MIPVIINNRDLLTWSKAMVEKIKTYDEVGEIIIIDNASTYEPLLEWYETKPCRIVRLSSNMGHTAPWGSGTVEELRSEYYVVTDSDMGLKNTPSDTLLYLKERLDKFVNLGKIGLGLAWEHGLETSMYYGHLQGHEQNRWKNSRVEDGVYFDVPIDTTFALYNKSDYFIGGASTTYPYVAKHFPWEFSRDDYNNNEEFKYYIEHATSSSSFKWFLGL